MCAWKESLISCSCRAKNAGMKRQNLIQWLVELQHKLNLQLHKASAVKLRALFGKKGNQLGWKCVGGSWWSKDIEPLISDESSLLLEEVSPPTLETASHPQRQQHPYPSVLISPHTVVLAFSLFTEGINSTLPKEMEWLPLRQLPCKTDLFSSGPSLLLDRHLDSNLGV